MLTQPRDRLLELLISQYQNSPNLIKHLQVYMELQQELFETFKDIVEQRYIDEAYGQQLDVIGEIIGASRTLEGMSVAGYYGFYDVVDALPPGDAKNPTLLSGYLRGEDQPDFEDYKMNDIEYRRFIEARIIKNHQAPTVDVMIQFFMILIGNPALDIRIREQAEGTEPAQVNVFLDEVHNIQMLSFIAATAGHIKPSGVDMVVEDRNGVIAIIKQ